MNRSTTVAAELSFGVHRSADEKKILTDPPVKLGRDWVKHVNQPQTDGELIALRRSVYRGRP